MLFNKYNSNIVNKKEKIYFIPHARKNLLLDDAKSISNPPVEVTHLPTAINENITLSTLVLNNKEINIYSDILQDMSFKRLLRDNFTTLSILGEALFISKNNYLIYPVVNKDDLMSIDTNNIAPTLGEPIAKLDTDFSDIYLSDFGLHTAEPLAGEQSTSTDKLDHWNNPLDDLDALNQLLRLERYTITSTEYEHNIIVQIAGDLSSSRAALKTMSKHPDKSIIIQYDIDSQQWRVLYGELNTQITGKIRWVVIGHGNRFDNRKEIRFQGNTAVEFVKGMHDLRNNLLINYTPDKIVLMGCHLSRGGIIENFALKATKRFANYGMNMPIVAYNRTVGHRITGHRVFWESDYEPEMTSSKEYKFTYQYDLATEQVYINNKLAILHFIDELRRGEIKIWQLIGDTELDPLFLLKKPDATLDFDLIKKISFNNKGYQCFLDLINENKQLSNDIFQQKLLEKLNIAGVIETPIWPMIEPLVIQRDIHAIPPKEVYVVIRAGNGNFSRLAAEYFTSDYPDNTLIIQLNANSQQMAVEYGDIEKLAGLPQKWLLLHSLHENSQFKHNLASSFNALKQQYALSEPKDISVWFTDQHGLLPLAQKERFTQQFSTLLEQQGMKQPVGLIDIPAISPPLGGGEDFATVEGVVAQTKTVRQQIDSLLRKLVLNKINLSEVTLAKYPFLKLYFTDADGLLDQYKLNIVLSDPLISPQAHQFFNDKSRNPVDVLAQWASLFEVDYRGTLQQHAREISRVMVAIRDNPMILRSLSKTSLQRLGLLFPALNGVNYGEVLALMNQPQVFLLFEDILHHFAKLNDHHFIGENAPLKDLTLSQAIEKYTSSRQLQLNNFGQLVHATDNHAPDSQIRRLNHQLYYGEASFSSLDNKFKFLYGALRRYLTPEYTVDYIERMSVLLQQQRQGTLLPAEAELLAQMQAFYQHSVEMSEKRMITRLDQSIKYAMMTIDPQQTLLLKGKSITYSVNYSWQNGQHDISFFDPTGVELRVRNNNLAFAWDGFVDSVLNYFNQQIEQPDGRFISRGKLAGFEPGEGNDFRADIQQVNYDYTDQTDFSLFLEPSHRPDIIPQSSEFDPLSHRLIDFNGEPITLNTLQRLGASIARKPVTIHDLQSADNLKNVRFDAEKLAAALTLMDGGKHDITLLRMIRRQINQVGVGQIIDSATDFQQAAIAIQQLNYIERHVDADARIIAGATLENLHHMGLKLPRYLRVANRAGQVMGGAGVILSLITLSTLLKQLDNPDLTRHEQAEIEKNIYITCASAFFNYGDMMIQPMLLEFAYAKTGSFNIAHTLAAKVVILFNLVGIGLDIYQAYDALSKLDGITDVKIRQDIFVSAGLSLGSAMVGGVTIVGILAGSAVIPVAGLALGGAILVGGMIYNGVRAVERLNDEINLSLGRKIEEGFRGAVGLAPTERSQHELSLHRYSEAFKNAAWETDLARFQALIFPAGFDRHLSVVETPTLAEMRRYYLVDAKGNYFAGQIGKHFIPHFGYQLGYTQRGAPSFTEQEADILLENYHLWVDGSVRIADQHDSDCDYKLTKRLKRPINYYRAGSLGSHEALIFDANYQHPLLAEFKQRHRWSTAQFTESVANQLSLSATIGWNLFSLQSKFAANRHPNLLANIQRYSQVIEHDLPTIADYLQNRVLTGQSVNLANGNDIFIGNKDEFYAFQILSGQKFFVGGDKMDYFYLTDCDIENLLAQDPDIPSKYLDGQGGNDSLIIVDRPLGYSAQIDLKNKSVIYHHADQNRSINFAHIENIQNIVVRGNYADIVRGDEQHNLLDGAYGNYQLYGEAGDDRLMLATGYANGGEGNDSYYLRRFEWHKQRDDFYQIEKRYDFQTHKFSDHQIINADYIQRSPTIYSCQIVIDERSKSASRVDLGYSLNEITQISIDGSDLLITLSISTPEIDGIDFSSISSRIQIRLKNVYITRSNGRVLCHDYTLRTRDGFLLTSQLVDLAPDSSQPLSTGLFNITYLQNNDQLSLGEVKCIDFDQQRGTLIIDETRTYTPPSWGRFNLVGQGENVFYSGDDSNNQISYLSAGNKIYVSRGQDIYQFNQPVENGEVVFDFSTVSDRYSENDKVILLLPNMNGYKLSMQDHTLQLMDRFGQQKLAVRFTHFEASMAKNVLIQDQYSNVFQVNLSSTGSHVAPLFSLNLGTEDDDVILLPQGYLSSHDAINSQSGHDVVTDNSRIGRVINASEGDDIVKVLAGYNSLYGGQGNDFLYGGEHQDFLLSDNGNDHLVGGGGNDHYLIDGRGQGEVNIDDEKGHNRIHLLYFSDIFTTETTPKGERLHCYTSSTGRTVKIKQPTLSDSVPSEQPHNQQPRNQVHHYAQLSAALSRLTEVNFTPLVDDLRDKSSQAKMSGEFASWKPVDSLQGALIGTERSPLFNQLNNSMILSHTHRWGDWLINTQAGNNTVTDNSGHGRVFKGGAGNDHLFTFGDGNNVLYGGAGDDKLVAVTGKGNDLLISLDGRDLLNGGEGDDSYLVDGQGMGDVTIIDFWGRNQLHLINFKPGISGNVIQLSATQIEETYESYHGRKVFLRKSIAPVINGVNLHYHSAMPANLTAAIKNSAENTIDNATENTIDNVTENTIDQLISDMVSWRIETASGTAELSRAAAADWQPTVMFERLF
ncbi:C80 family cysteine peptidase [Moellerella wisconsensis]|uniref:C80 family cysteine peptidase n=1 Tax=Moellerella wisconsensis TaxID=158849 RepID=UPI00240F90E2|nr:C80 family cysteine peptidase [Moellerella wisconsensis]